MARERYERVSFLLSNLGTYLTVSRTPLKHVSIKICISSPDFDDMVMHELNINERLNEKASQSGSAFIRIPIDDFVATGPAGIAHLCLVFEPLREPISRFQYRLAGDCIPPQLLKVWVGFILEGLEYLHNDCQIVHTGRSCMLPLAFTRFLTGFRSQGGKHPLNLRGQKCAR